MRRIISASLNMVRSDWRGSRLRIDLVCSRCRHCASVSWSNSLEQTDLLDWISVRSSTDVLCLLQVYPGDFDDCPTFCQAPLAGWDLRLCVKCQWIHVGPLNLSSCGIHRPTSDFVQYCQKLGRLFLLTWVRFTCTQVWNCHCTEMFVYRLNVSWS